MPEKHIVIRDRGKTLELQPETIDRVEVYTTSEEKTRELEERRRRRVPVIAVVKEKKSRWRFFRT
jgi:hypothetical protein